MLLLLQIAGNLCQSRAGTDSCFYVYSQRAVFMYTDDFGICLRRAVFVYVGRGVKLVAYFPYTGRSSAFRHARTHAHTHTHKHTQIHTQLLQQNDDIVAHTQTHTNTHTLTTSPAEWWHCCLVVVGSSWIPFSCFFFLLIYFYGNFHLQHHVYDNRGANYISGYARISAQHILT